MKTDEEFRKKVLECKDAKKRMALVKAGGFDFTEKDIKVVTAGIDDSVVAKFFAGYDGCHGRGCGGTIAKVDIK